MIRKLQQKLWTFFLLVFLLFLSSCGGGDGGPSNLASDYGKMNQSVFDPLAREIDQREEVLTNSFNSPQMSSLVSDFADFAENYDSGSSLVAVAEPFCKIGGIYSMDIFVNSTPKDPQGGYGLGGPDPLEYQKRTRIFSCHTTQYQLHTLRIPSVWKDANLVLYCGDGGLINFEKVLVDVIASKVKTYKTCVIKNLDLKEHNTILYSLESGNATLDSDEDYFFDTQNPQNNKFVEGLTYEGEENGVYLFKSDDDREYYVDYVGEDKVLSMRTFKTALDFQLLSGTGMPDSFQNSRVALFRSHGAGNYIYGYETSLSILEYGRNEEDEPSVQSTHPVYRILFSSGYAFDADKCLQYLASYDAEVSENYEQAKVLCDPQGQIFINTEKIDAELGEGAAYNLFKNIILATDPGTFDSDASSEGTLSSQGPTGGVDLNIWERPDLENGGQPTPGGNFWLTHCLVRDLEFPLDMILEKDESVGMYSTTGGENVDCAANSQVRTCLGLNQLDGNGEYKYLRCTSTETAP
ncbi:MAG: hypothetical protein H6500_01345 [Candidatus Woesearchaeota archaeon]|nr:hypothetical protein [Nanoarchaeota archaeon]USN44474.1 MAG: hypothetical protein H6500_01345 [Candidatus Woesearchaeota archaeon]